jgi:hypothetical protein
MSDTDSARIDVIQTYPAQILVHTIEEHQLDKLVNISRPISLALGGLCGGALFSFLPSALGSGKLLGTPAFGPVDLFYIIVAILAFIGMMAFGFFAIRGEKDARKLVESIKSRQKKPF